MSSSQKILTPVHRASCTFFFIRLVCRYQPLVRHNLTRAYEGINIIVSSRRFFSATSGVDVSLSENAEAKESSKILNFPEKSKAIRALMPHLSKIYNSLAILSARSTTDPAASAEDLELSIVKASASINNFLLFAQKEDWEVFCTILSRFFSVNATEAPEGTSNVTGAPFGIRLLRGGDRISCGFTALLDIFGCVISAGERLGASDYSSSKRHVFERLCADAAELILTRPSDVSKVFVGNSVEIAGTAVMRELVSDKLAARCIESPVPEHILLRHSGCGSFTPRTAADERFLRLKIFAEGGSDIRTVTDVRSISMAVAAAHRAKVLSRYASQVGASGREPAVKLAVVLNDALSQCFSLSRDEGDASQRTVLRATAKEIAAIKEPFADNSNMLFTELLAVQQVSSEGTDERLLIAQPEAVSAAQSYIKSISGAYYALIVAVEANYALLRELKKLAAVPLAKPFASSTLGNLAHSRSPRLQRTIDAEAAAQTARNNFLLTSFAKLLCELGRNVKELISGATDLCTLLPSVRAASCTDKTTVSKRPFMTTSNSNQKMTTLSLAATQVLLIPSASCDEPQRALNQILASLLESMVNHGVSTEAVAALVHALCTEVLNTVFQLPHDYCFLDLSNETSSHADELSTVSKSIKFDDFNEAEEAFSWLFSFIRSTLLRSMLFGHTVTLLPVSCVTVLKQEDLIDINRVNAKADESSLKQLRASEVLNVATAAVQNEDMSSETSADIESEMTKEKQIDLFLARIDSSVSVGSFRLEPSVRLNPFVASSLVHFGVLSNFSLITAPLKHAQDLLVSVRTSGFSSSAFDEENRLTRIILNTWLKQQDVKLRDTLTCAFAQMLKDSFKGVIQAGTSLGPESIDLRAYVDFFIQSLLPLQNKNGKPTSLLPLSEPVLAWFLVNCCGTPAVAAPIAEALRDELQGTAAFMVGGAEPHILRDFERLAFLCLVISIEPSINSRRGSVDDTQFFPAGRLREALRPLFAATAGTIEGKERRDSVRVGVPAVLYFARAHWPTILEDAREHNVRVSGSRVEARMEVSATGGCSDEDNQSRGDIDDTLRAALEATPTVKWMNETPLVVLFARLLISNTEKKNSGAALELIYRCQRDLQSSAYSRRPADEQYKSSAEGGDDAIRSAAPTARRLKRQKRDDSTAPSSSMPIPSDTSDVMILRARAAGDSSALELPAVYHSRPYPLSDYERMALLVEMRQGLAQVAAAAGFFDDPEKAGQKTAAALVQVLPKTRGRAADVRELLISAREAFNSEVEEVLPDPSLLPSVQQHQLASFAVNLMTRYDCINRFLLAIDFELFCYPIVVNGAEVGSVLLRAMMQRGVRSRRVARACLSYVERVLIPRQRKEFALVSKTAITSYLDRQRVGPQRKVEFEKMSEKERKVMVREIAQLMSESTKVAIEMLLNHRQQRVEYCRLALSVWPVGQEQEDSTATSFSKTAAAELECDEYEEMILRIKAILSMTRVYLYGKNNEGTIDELRSVPDPEHQARLANWCVAYYQHLYKIISRSYELEISTKGSISKESNVVNLVTHGSNVIAPLDDVDDLFRVKNVTYKDIESINDGDHPLLAGMLHQLFERSCSSSAILVRELFLRVPRSAQNVKAARIFSKRTSTILISSGESREHVNNLTNIIDNQVIATPGQMFAPGFVHARSLCTILDDIQLAPFQSTNSSDAPSEWAKSHGLIQADLRCSENDALIIVKEFLTPDQLQLVRVNEKLHMELSLFEEAQDWESAAAVLLRYADEHLGYPAEPKLLLRVLTIINKYYDHDSETMSHRAETPQTANINEISLETDGLIRDKIGGGGEGVSSISTVDLFSQNGNTLAVGEQQNNNVEDENISVQDTEELYARAVLASRTRNEVVRLAELWGYLKEDQSFIQQANESEKGADFLESLFSLLALRPLRHLWFLVQQLPEATLLGHAQTLIKCLKNVYAEICLRSAVRSCEENSGVVGRRGKKQKQSRSRAEETASELIKASLNVGVNSKSMLNSNNINESIVPYSIETIFDILSATHGAPRDTELYFFNRIVDTLDSAAARIKRLEVLNSGVTKDLKCASSIKLTASPKDKMSEEIEVLYQSKNTPYSVSLLSLEKTALWCCFFFEGEASVFVRVLNESIADTVSSLRPAGVSLAKLFGELKNSSLWTLPSEDIDEATEQRCILLVRIARTLVDIAIFANDVGTLYSDMQTVTRQSLLSEGIIALESKWGVASKKRQLPLPGLSATATAEVLYVLASMCIFTLKTLMRKPIKKSFTQTTLSNSIRRLTVARAIATDVEEIVLYALSFAPFAQLLNGGGFREVSRKESSTYLTLIRDAVLKHYFDSHSLSSSALEGSDVLNANKAFNETLSSVFNKELPNVQKDLQLVFPEGTIQIPSFNQRMLEVGKILASMHFFIVEATKRGAFSEIQYQNLISRGLAPDRFISSQNVDSFAAMMLWLMASTMAAASLPFTRITRISHAVPSPSEYVTSSLFRGLHGLLSDLISLEEIPDDSTHPLACKQIAAAVAVLRLLTGRSTGKTALPSQSSVCSSETEKKLETSSLSHTEAMRVLENFVLGDANSTDNIALRSYLCSSHLRFVLPVIALSAYSTGEDDAIDRILCALRSFSDNISKRPTEDSNIETKSDENGNLILLAQRAILLLLSTKQNLVNESSDEGLLFCTSRTHLGSGVPSQLRLSHPAPPQFQTSSAVRMLADREDVESISAAKEATSEYSCLPEWALSAFSSVLVIAKKGSGHHVHVALERLYNATLTVSASEDREFYRLTPTMYDPAISISYSTVFSKVVKQGLRGVSNNTVKEAVLQISRCATALALGNSEPVCDAIERFAWDLPPQKGSKRTGVLKQLITVAEEGSWALRWPIERLFELLFFLKETDIEEMGVLLTNNVFAQPNIVRVLEMTLRMREILQREFSSLAIPSHTEEKTEKSQTLTNLELLEIVSQTSAVRESFLRYLFPVRLLVDIVLPALARRSFLNTSQKPLLSLIPSNLLYTALEPSDAASLRYLASKKGIDFSVAQSLSTVTVTPRQLYLLYNSISSFIRTCFTQPRGTPGEALFPSAIYGILRHPSLDPVCEDSLRLTIRAEHDCLRVFKTAEEVVESFPQSTDFKGEKTYSDSKIRTRVLSELYAELLGEWMSRGSVKEANSSRRDDVRITTLFALLDLLGREAADIRTRSTIVLKERGTLGTLDWSPRIVPRAFFANPTLILATPLVVASRGEDSVTPVRGKALFNPYISAGWIGNVSVLLRHLLISNRRIAGAMHAETIKLSQMLKKAGKEQTKTHLAEKCRLFGRWVTQFHKHPSWPPSGFLSDAAASELKVVSASEHPRQFTNEQLESVCAATDDGIDAIISRAQGISTSSLMTIRFHILHLPLEVRQYNVFRAEDGMRGLPSRLIRPPALQNALVYYSDPLEFGEEYIIGVEDTSKVGQKFVVEFMNWRAHRHRHEEWLIADALRSEVNNERRKIEGGVAGRFSQGMAATDGKADIPSIDESELSEDATEFEVEQSKDESETTQKLSKKDKTLRVRQKSALFSLLTVTCESELQTLSVIIATNKPHNQRYSMRGFYFFLSYLLELVEQRQNPLLCLHAIITICGKTTKFAVDHRLLVDDGLINKSVPIEGDAGQISEGTEAAQVAPKVPEGTAAPPDATVAQRYGPLKIFEVITTLSLEDRNRLRPRFNSDSWALVSLIRDRIVPLILTRGPYSGETDVDSTAAYTLVRTAWLGVLRQMSAISAAEFRRLIADDATCSSIPDLPLFIEIIHHYMATVAAAYAEDLTAEEDNKNGNENARARIGNTQRATFPPQLSDPLFSFCETEISDNVHPDIREIVITEVFVPLREKYKKRIAIELKAIMTGSELLRYCNKFYALYPEGNQEDLQRYLDTALIENINEITRRLTYLSKCRNRVLSSKDFGVTDSNAENKEETAKDDTPLAEEETVAFNKDRKRVSQEASNVPLPASSTTYTNISELGNARDMSVVSYLYRKRDLMWYYGSGSEVVVRRSLTEKVNSSASHAAKQDSADGEEELEKHEDEKTKQNINPETPLFALYTFPLTNLRLYEKFNFSVIHAVPLFYRMTYHISRMRGALRGFYGALSTALARPLWGNSFNEQEAPQLRSFSHRHHSERPHKLNLAVAWHRDLQEVFNVIREAVWEYPVLNGEPYFLSQGDSLPPSGSVKKVTRSETLLSSWLLNTFIIGTPQIKNPEGVECLPDGRRRWEPPLVEVLLDEVRWHVQHCGPDPSVNPDAAIILVNVVRRMLEELASLAHGQGLALLNTINSRRTDLTQRNKCHTAQRIDSLFPMHGIDENNSALFLSILAAFEDIKDWPQMMIPFAPGTEIFADSNKDKNDEHMATLPGLITAANNLIIPRFYQRLPTADERTFSSTETSVGLGGKSREAENLSSELSTGDSTRLVHEETPLFLSIFATQQVGSMLIRLTRELFLADSLRVQGGVRAGASIELFTRHPGAFAGYMSLVLRCAFAEFPGGPPPIYWRNTTLELLAAARVTLRPPSERRYDTSSITPEGDNQLRAVVTLLTYAIVSFHQLRRVSINDKECFTYAAEVVTEIFCFLTEFVDKSFPSGALIVADDLCEALNVTASWTGIDCIVNSEKSGTSVAEWAEGFKAYSKGSVQGYALATVLLVVFGTQWCRKFFIRTNSGDERIVDRAVMINARDLAIALAGGHATFTGITSSFEAMTATEGFCPARTLTRDILAELTKHLPASSLQAIQENLNSSEGFQLLAPSELAIKISQLPSLGLPESIALAVQDPKQTFCAAALNAAELAAAGTSMIQVSHDIITAPLEDEVKTRLSHVCSEQRVSLNPFHMAGTLTAFVAIGKFEEALKFFSLCTAGTVHGLLLPETSIAVCVASISVLRNINIKTFSKVTALAGDAFGNALHYSNSEVKKQLKMLESIVYWCIPTAVIQQPLSLITGLAAAGRTSSAAVRAAEILLKLLYRLSILRRNILETYEECKKHFPLQAKRLYSVTVAEGKLLSEENLKSNGEIQSAENFEQLTRIVAFLDKCAKDISHLMVLITTRVVSEITTAGWGDADFGLLLDYFFAAKSIQEGDENLSGEAVLASFFSDSLIAVVQELFRPRSAIIDQISFGGSVAGPRDLPTFYTDVCSFLARFEISLQARDVYTTALKTALDNKVKYSCALMGPLGPIRSPRQLLKSSSSVLQSSNASDANQEVNFHTLIHKVIFAPFDVYFSRMVSVRAFDDIPLYPVDIMQLVSSSESAGTGGNVAVNTKKKSINGESNAGVTTLGLGAFLQRVTYLRRLCVVTMTIRSCGVGGAALTSMALETLLREISMIYKNNQKMLPIKQSRRRTVLSQLSSDTGAVATAAAAVEGQLRERIFETVTACSSSALQMLVTLDPVVFSTSQTTANALRLLRTLRYMGVPLSVSGATWETGLQWYLCSLRSLPKDEENESYREINYRCITDPFALSHCPILFGAELQLRDRISVEINFLQLCFHEYVIPFCGTTLFTSVDRKYILPQYYTFAMRGGPASSRTPADEERSFGNDEVSLELHRGGLPMGYKHATELREMYTCFHRLLAEHLFTATQPALHQMVMWFFCSAPLDDTGTSNSRTAQFNGVLCPQTAAGLILNGLLDRHSRVSNKQRSSYDNSCGLDKEQLSPQEMASLVLAPFAVYIARLQQRHRHADVFKFVESIPPKSISVAIRKNGETKFNILPLREALREAILLSANAILPMPRATADLSRFLEGSLTVGAETSWEILSSRFADVDTVITAASQKIISLLAEQNKDYVAFYRGGGESERSFLLKRQGQRIEATLGSFLNELKPNFSTGWRILHSEKACMLLFEKIPDSGERLEYENGLTEIESSNVTKEGLFLSSKHFMCLILAVISADYEVTENILRKVPTQIAEQLPHTMTSHCKSSDGVELPPYVLSFVLKTLSSENSPAFLAPFFDAAAGSLAALLVIGGVDIYAGGENQNRLKSTSKDSIKTSEVLSTISVEATNLLLRRLLRCEVIDCGNTLRRILVYTLLAKNQDEQGKKLSYCADTPLKAKFYPFESNSAIRSHDRSREAPKLPSATEITLAIIRQLLHISFSNFALSQKGGFSESLQLLSDGASIAARLVAGLQLACSGEGGKKDFSNHAIAGETVFDNSNPLGSMPSSSHLFVLSAGLLPDSMVSVQQNTVSYQVAKKARVRVGILGDALEALKSYAHALHTQCSVLLSPHSQVWGLSDGAEIMEVMNKLENTIKKPCFQNSDFVASLFLWAELRKKLVDANLDTLEGYYNNSKNKQNNVLQFHSNDTEAIVLGAFANREDSFKNYLRPRFAAAVLSSFAPQYLLITEPLQPILTPSITNVQTALRAVSTPILFYLGRSFEGLFSKCGRSGPALEGAIADAFFLWKLSERCLLFDLVKPHLKTSFTTHNKSFRFDFYCLLALFVSEASTILTITERAAVLQDAKSSLGFSSADVVIPTMEEIVDILLKEVSVLGENASSYLDSESTLLDALIHCFYWLISAANLLLDRVSHSFVQRADNLRARSLAGLSYLFENATKHHEHTPESIFHHSLEPNALNCALTLAVTVASAAQDPFVERLVDASVKLQIALRGEALASFKIFLVKKYRTEWQAKYDQTVRALSAQASQKLVGQETLNRSLSTSRSYPPGLAAERALAAASVQISDSSLSISSQLLLCARLWRDIFKSICEADCEVARKQAAAALPLLSFFSPPWLLTSDMSSKGTTLSGPQCTRITAFSIIALKANLCQHSCSKLLASPAGTMLQRFLSFCPLPRQAGNDEEVSLDTSENSAPPSLQEMMSILTRGITAYLSSSNRFSTSRQNVSSLQTLLGHLVAVSYGADFEPTLFDFFTLSIIQYTFAASVASISTLPKNCLNVLLFDKTNGLSAAFGRIADALKLFQVAEGHRSESELHGRTLFLQVLFDVFCFADELFLKLTGGASSIEEQRSFALFIHLIIKLVSTVYFPNGFAARSTFVLNSYSPPPRLLKLVSPQSVLRVSLLVATSISASATDLVPLLQLVGSLSLPLRSRLPAEDIASVLFVQATAKLLSAKKSVDEEVKDLNKGAEDGDCGNAQRFAERVEHLLADFLNCEEDQEGINSSRFFEQTKDLSDLLAATLVLVAKPEELHKVGENLSFASLVSRSSCITNCADLLLLTAQHCVSSADMRAAHRSLLWRFTPAEVKHACSKLRICFGVNGKENSLASLVEKSLNKNLSAESKSSKDGVTLIQAFQKIVTETADDDLLHVSQLTAVLHTVLEVAYEAEASKENDAEEYEKLYKCVCGITQLFNTVDIMSKQYIERFKDLCRNNSVEH